MVGAASGVDKTGGTGVVITGAAALDVPKVLGGGVPGGVVSMPLSSIIFYDGVLCSGRSALYSGRSALYNGIHPSSPGRHVICPPLTVALPRNPD